MPLSFNLITYRINRERIIAGNIKKIPNNTRFILKRSKISFYQCE